MTTFIAIYQAQKQLQEETYGYDFDGMSDEDRIQFIKNMAFALEDEVHEAVNETGWKPWQTSRHINHEAYREELIDAFHFLLNLIIAAGIDPEVFVNLFFAKQRKNRARQLNGYDGVMGKCPKCKRSFDGAGVQCNVALSPDTHESTHGWCAVYGEWRKE